MCPVRWRRDLGGGVDQGTILGGRSLGLKRIIVMCALVAALAVPVANADNGTSTKGYGGQAQVQDEISKGGGGGSGSGSLPLTGMDLGLLVLGGGLFAGVGFAVRRASRRHE